MRKIEKGERGSSESERAHVENGKKAQVEESAHEAREPSTFLYWAARAGTVSAKWESRPLSCHHLPQSKLVLTRYTTATVISSGASDISHPVPQSSCFRMCLQELAPALSILGAKHTESVLGSP